MPRDEFSNDVKSKLAQRAGYMCSICQSLTIAASSESDKSVNLTGVAAHISAASKGGRRYNATLTSSERSDISNGIWLCNNHADLIDGDATTYTISYLSKVKNDHEDKIKFKHAGINTENGIISRIEISNFGNKKIECDLVNKNVILGENGTGKTLICDMIASLTDRSFFSKWIEDEQEVNSHCNIYYFKNQHERFSLSVDRNKMISYSFNESRIPILAPSIDIVYLNEDYREALTSEDREKKNIVWLLANYFRLSEQEFVGIIHSISGNRKYLIEDIYLTNSDTNLMVKYGVNSRHFSFAALSGGEKAMVILEVAFKIASYRSKFNSTLLMIERNSVASLDYFGINRVFKLMDQTKLDFQVIFTSTYNEDYEFLGLNVVKL